MLLLPLPLKRKVSEKGNSMSKNRHAVILFSPAMGRKGEMSRVIRQGEFTDCNFFKTVITLMADKPRELTQR